MGFTVSLLPVRSVFSCFCLIPHFPLFLKNLWKRGFSFLKRLFLRKTFAGKQLFICGAKARTTCSSTVMLIPEGFPVALWTPSGSLRMKKSSFERNNKTVAKARTTCNSLLMLIPGGLNGSKTLALWTPSPFASKQQSSIACSQHSFGCSLSSHDSYFHIEGSLLHFIPSNASSSACKWVFSSAAMERKASRTPSRSALSAKAEYFSTA